jgi:phosphopantothenoylcysteine synthetase/decarboxylase
VARTNEPSIVRLNCDANSDGRTDNPTKAEHGSMTKLERKRFRDLACCTTCSPTLAEFDDDDDEDDDEDDDDDDDDEPPDDELTSSRNESDVRRY